MVKNCCGLISDQLGYDLSVFGISIAQKCDKKLKKTTKIIQENMMIIYCIYYFDTIFDYNRKIYIIYFYSGERKM